MKLFTILQHAFADQGGLIILPPGISFYLFESLSYVIDVYRGVVRPPKKTIDFLVFISMFPRFVAGPIVRFKRMQDSIIRYEGTRYLEGLFVFCIGLCVKCLFADSFEKFVSSLWGVHFTLLESWAALLSFSFQIYLDFSAYSLMAIGIGMAIGFRFPDNFREPYLARSITEFWRTWHISLSSWLRDYLYLPLGGNRHGAWRRDLNLMVTMLVGGIWHGPSFTFMIWGGYHGLLLVLDKSLFSRVRLLQTRAVTLFLSTIGWVFFKSADPAQMRSIFAGLFGANGAGGAVLSEKLSEFSIQATLCSVGVLWIFLFEPELRKLRSSHDWSAFGFNTVQVSWPIVAGITGVASLLALILNLSNGMIPFLYFQF